MSPSQDFALGYKIKVNKSLLSPYFAVNYTFPTAAAIPDEMARDCFHARSQSGTKSETGVPGAMREVEIGGRDRERQKVNSVVDNAMGPWRSELCIAELTWSLGYSHEEMCATYIE
jgi:hypothetical protein